jgi:hypothetical protein
MTEEEALDLLRTLRRRAQEIWSSEIAHYDEDRVLGGDPIVYEAAAERVLRELRAWILKLLLDED